MAHTNESPEPAATAVLDAAELTPLLTSRFLFVDVAAQRAKQLRRGALARIERPISAPHRLERVAMEEVRAGMIHYSLPPVDAHGRHIEAK